MTNVDANSLGLSAAQYRNAVTVVNVGRQQGFSLRDIEIAVMVAIDESGLQNYANANNPESLNLPHDAVGSDHGSVGIFQQQVGGAPNSTSNWGTTAELMNPAIASTKFYGALAKVSNRNNMNPWNVGQTVQGSAYADGSNYQQQWSRGKSVADAIYGGTVATPVTTTPTTPAAGVTAPVAGATGAVGAVVGGVFGQFINALSGLFPQSGPKPATAPDGGSGVVAESFPGGPPPFDPNSLTTPLGDKQRNAIIAWKAKWSAWTAATAGVPGSILLDPARVAAWTTFFQGMNDGELIKSYQEAVNAYNADPAGNANKPTARSQVDIIFSPLGRILLFAVGGVLIWWSFKQLAGGNSVGTA